MAEFHFYDPDKITNTDIRLKLQSLESFRKRLDTMLTALPKLDDAVGKNRVKLFKVEEIRGKLGMIAKLIVDGREGEALNELEQKMSELET
jgi:hypothetical protein